MMGSCSVEGDDQFFDCREDLSDLGSDSRLIDSASSSFEYKIWMKKPDSVDERRSRLLRWMGISSDENPTTIENSGDGCVENFELHAAISRINEDSGAVLRTSCSEEWFSSSETFLSFRSNEDSELLENGKLEADNYNMSEAKALGELRHNNSTPGRLCEGGSSPPVIVRGCQTQRPSPSVQRLLWREGEASSFPVMKRKLKHGWLRRLSALTCIVNGQAEAGGDSNDLDPVRGMRTRRIAVYPQRKRSKELSSLYEDQEFIAHEGCVLTMKFSLDGQYLASAGEDGIVRVWKVIEEERSNIFDISKMDPSSLYFSVNHLSELSPLVVDKVEFGKVRRPNKLSDLACVIFPPKVFRLLEKPLHEFHGHNGEILDLSWSRKGFLLSSSVDKTVRLWQVGSDQCLRIFSHNNYVTCVEFNPMDDNYFISGSIDGKVRIWEVLRRQVVDWTDIREIVTAVCYRPDGQGGIVGTMTGNCCFYDITDNQLQLDTQIWLQGKKRLASRSITGFQFCPADPRKVMVTSADSHARILSGLDVISKFKGLGNAGSQISATFTTDGRHIVSMGEDSHVYVWNYTSQEKKFSFLTKNTNSSESFPSHNASVAIPWPGLGTRPEPPFLPPETLLLPPTFSSDLLLRRSSGLLADEKLAQKRPLSSSNSFALSPGILLEPSPKGSATWPEETLCNSSCGVSPKTPTATPRVWKSGYRYLKTACHSITNSPHMWGMVIVTAGWDGRIRTFHNYGLPLHL